MAHRDSAPRATPRPLAGALAAFCLSVLPAAAETGKSPRAMFDLCRSLTAAAKPQHMAMLEKAGFTANADPVATHAPFATHIGQWRDFSGEELNDFVSRSLSRYAADLNRNDLHATAQGTTLRLGALKGVIFSSGPRDMQSCHVMAMGDLRAGKVDAILNGSGEPFEVVSRQVDPGFLYLNAQSETATEAYDVTFISWNYQGRQAPAGSSPVWVVTLSYSPKLIN